MYHSLLNAIFNRFAPYKTINIKEHSYSPWFNTDCHANHRKSQSTEWRLHLTCSHANQLAWKNHLQLKWSLICNKQAAYWTSVIDEDAGNSCRLGQRLNALLACDPGNETKRCCITSEVLTNYFATKVEMIRAVTATSPPPVLCILTEMTFSEFTQMFCK